MNLRSKNFYLMLVFLALLPILQIQLANLKSLFPKNKVDNLAQAQTTNDNQSIRLNLLQPLNKVVVNEKRFLLKGNTSPFADVFVNQQSLKADEQGNFSTLVNLEEGLNNLVVVVNDQKGNFSEKEIMVDLQLSL